MFTGLIAELGTVERLTEKDRVCQLTVRAASILNNVKTGDSIAVNGACLTVTSLHSHSFTADVMPETIRRTTLHQLQPGDRVNLEKALRPVDGLDGHIVQGHVEGIGKIRQITPEGNALVYHIEAPGGLMRYIVEKGSIAVDGISLTVTETDDSGFGVSLIPHTARMTTLGFKDVGDRVNLETDIIARYVEKLVKSGPVGSGAVFADNKRNRLIEETGPSDTGLTKEFLIKHGF